MNFSADLFSLLKSSCQRISAPGDLFEVYDVGESWHGDQSERSIGRYDEYFGKRHTGNHLNNAGIRHRCLS